MIVNLGCCVYEQGKAEKIVYYSFHFCEGARKSGSYASSITLKA